MNFEITKTSIRVTLEDILKKCNPELRSALEHIIEDIENLNTFSSATFAVGLEMLIKNLEWLLNSYADKLPESVKQALRIALAQARAALRELEKEEEEREF